MQTLLFGGLAVLGMAILAFVWLSDAQHKKTAVFVGYGIILASGFSLNLWVYNACLACQNVSEDSLCCEWTGVGHAIYSAMTLLLLVIFSIFIFVHYLAKKN